MVVVSASQQHTKQVVDFVRQHALPRARQFGNISYTCSHYLRALCCSLGAFVHSRPDRNTERVPNQCAHLVFAHVDAHAGDVETLQPRYLTEAQWTAMLQAPIPVLGRAASRQARADVVAIGKLA